MDKTFDLLEERIRKTAAVVERLRKENAALEKESQLARRKLEEAEKRLKALEAASGSPKPDGAEMAALEEELRRLKGEREEIRARIGRLVDLLDSIE